MADKKHKKNDMDTGDTIYTPPAPGKEPEKEPEPEPEGLTREQNEEIVETGSLTQSRGKHVIHCLTIVGQVEGHYILPSQNKTTKYEHVIPQLVAIEEDPAIEGLIIILNTVGGDVEAGLAIAELIAGMKKPTVSLVLGGGHSIGVPLAVSAKHSFIAPSASMTVHPVRMNGLVLGVPQTLSYFDKMQDRIVRFVCDNSRISQERFRRLIMNTGELVMDMGTVLDGKNAVSEGLIDSLGGLSDAIAELYSQIERPNEESTGQGKKRARQKKQAAPPKGKKRAQGKNAPQPAAPPEKPPEKKRAATGKGAAGRA